MSSTHTNGGAGVPTSNILLFARRNEARGPKFHRWRGKVRIQSPASSAKKNVMFAFYTLNKCNVHIFYHFQIAGLLCVRALHKGLIVYTLDTHVQSRNCHGLSERDAQKETYLVPWFVVGVRKVFGQTRKMKDVNFFMEDF